MTYAEKLKQQIIEKALTDEEFKKLLKSNPKKAIEDEFNINVGDVQIGIHEETAKSFHIVIPYDFGKVDEGMLGTW